MRLSMNQIKIHLFQNLSSPKIYHLPLNFVISFTENSVDEEYLFSFPYEFS